MTRFYVEYNPYKNETLFFTDREDVDMTKFKIIQANKYRMQVWLEKMEFWNGFIEELCFAINDNELQIDFKGRRIDFEDLVIYIDEYEGDVNITLNFIEAKNDSQILEEIEMIVKKCENSPVEELKNARFMETYDRVINSKFKISVIATMSSGKSTLVNAILGKDLLPSKNEACTATIARITDSSNPDDDFTIECRDVEGNVVIPKTEANLDNIEEFNENPDVLYLDIEGHIPHIDTSSMSLVLQDTPGPNNSRDESHAQITNALIKGEENSVVMYIMNATQFAIDDDKQLLLTISDAMKRQGKQSRDRFIFIINKCDRLDPDRGETVDKLLNSVELYLKKEFGIDEPSLFPTSALTGKIIRKYLNGEPLTRIEKRELDVDLFIEEEKCHFEKYASLSPSSKKKLKESLVEAMKIEDEEESMYNQALIHTGVPAVEEAINAYLQKYAYPMKIDEAVKDFIEIIDEQDMIAKFDKKIVEDSNALDVIRSQLNQAYKKQEEGLRFSEIFKDKINKLMLDEKIVKKQKMEVESTLENLTRNYIGKNEMDKSEAEELVARFNEEVTAFQQDCTENVQRIIEQELVEKGEIMLSEYKNYVDNILVNIQIQDFKFNFVRNFNKNTFKSVNELIRKNTKKEEIYADVEYTNFNRAWYEVWKPKTITVHKTVGVKQTVNVSEVIQNEIPEISNIIKSNIDELFNDAKNQVEEFKSQFNESMDELNKVVADMLKDIDKKVKDTKVLKEQLEANKNKIEWISNIKMEIDNLMNF